MNFVADNYSAIKKYLQIVVFVYVFLASTSHVRNFWRSGVLQRFALAKYKKFLWWKLPKWKKTLERNTLFRAINYSLSSEETLTDYWGKKELLHRIKEDDQIEFNYTDTTSKFTDMSEESLKEYHCEILKEETDDEKDEKYITNSDLAYNEIMNLMDNDNSDTKYTGQISDPFTLRGLNPARDLSVPIAPKQYNDAIERYLTNLTIWTSKEPSEDKYPTPNSYKFTEDHLHQYMRCVMRDREDGTRIPG